MGRAGRLDEQQAGPEHLFRLINGHWGIESLHWVRDVTYDEDRSQARTGTLPRVLATLRNLAISIICYATERTVNIAAATRSSPGSPTPSSTYSASPTDFATDRAPGPGNSC